MATEARKRMQEMNLQQKQTGNGHGGNAINAETPHAGLASAADFVNNYKTNFYRLTDSNLVEYQALALGDFALLTGTPIDRKMIERGLDAQNQEARQEYEEQMTPAERAEMAIAEEHLLNARRVIAKSVISVKFSSKPQKLCGSGIVSLDLISDFDIANMYGQILIFSKGDESMEDTFRRIIEINQTYTPEPDTASAREPDAGESAEDSTDG